MQAFFGYCALNPPGMLLLYQGACYGTKSSCSSGGYEKAASVLPTLTSISYGCIRVQNLRQHTSIMYSTHTYEVRYSYLEYVFALGLRQEMDFAIYSLTAGIHSSQLDMSIPCGACS